MKLAHRISAGILVLTQLVGVTSAAHATGIETFAQGSGSAYTVTIPAAVEFGTLSRTESSVCDYQIGVEIGEGVTGSVTLAAAEDGTVAQEGGAGSIPFKNSLGTQAVALNQSVDGSLSIQAADVQKAPPGKYSGTVQFEISYARDVEVTYQYKGTAKVTQFGKYDVNVIVTAVKNVITGVSISGDGYGGTYADANRARMDKIIAALAEAWNGMRIDDAEAVYGVPEVQVDAVSGATYSAKGARDAVMNALSLTHEEEPVTVPKEVPSPGTYNIPVAYYSDVVYHSLVKDDRTEEATLVVDEQGNMLLTIPLYSGTAKEPLYTMGFDGYFENNDLSDSIVAVGEEDVTMADTDFADENFSEERQIVSGVTFPLTGELAAIYHTQTYLYVPAMKKLNGEINGVKFENGMFHVTCFAKLYWDELEDQVATPVITPNGGTFTSTQAVSISCQTAGATVYYTTNGTQPTTSSTRYTDAFTLSDTSTVRAVAVKEGLQNSHIASTTFTKKADPVVPPEDEVDVSKNGHYKVPIGLWHETKEQTSMGDAAFKNNRYAVVTTKNGKYTIEFATNPIEIGDIVAGIGSIYSADGRMDEVEATYAQLPSGKNYIQTCTFTTDDLYKSFMVTMTVPDSPMVGEYEARLILEWDEAEETDEDLDPDDTSGSGKMPGTEETQATDDLEVITSGESLAVSDLEKLIKDEKVLLIENEEDKASAQLDGKALEVIAEEAGTADVTMEIGKADTDTLTDAQREIVGGQDAYELQISADEKAISDLKDGTVTITLPYILKDGENAECLIVWCVDENGDVKSYACAYHASEKTVTFQADRVGLYLVVYDEDLVWENPFTDVEGGTWYYDGVCYAVQNGLFKGTSETTFSPDTQMTRGMLVTVLYRLAGEPEVSGGSDFADVLENAYDTHAVMWAQSSEIAKGYGNGLFGVEDVITREQMATILFRYAEKQGFDVSQTRGLEDFTDQALVGDYAVEAMEWAVGTGLIVGTSESTLSPLGSASRAQVATVLMRLADKFSQ